MNPTFRGASRQDVPQLLGMMEDFNRLEGIPWRRERSGLALLELLSTLSLGRVGVVEVEPGLGGYGLLAYGFDLEFGGKDAILNEFSLLPRLRGKG